MNSRKPTGRPGRPAAGPKPARSTNISKNYWHHRRYWPRWRDYCDYDYNWYDYYDYYDNDYIYDNYLSPRKSKGMPAGQNWEDNEITEDYLQLAYQQGFRDGWVAAMEYAIYGEEMPPDSNPEPTPPMPPAPPTPSPTPV